MESWSKPTVALVGLGGYGNFYLKGLLSDEGRDMCELTAGVDPFPNACNYLQELQDSDIPVYDDLTQLFEHHTPELVILATPIHLHAYQTQFVCEQGVPVLCEKPLAGSMEDAMAMIQARDKARVPVGVGYQLSWTDATQALKQDIREGVLGRPKRFKTICQWPRPASYYQRNKWAGRKLTESGHVVNDSPLNNATAHFMHNMLYLLGAETDTSVDFARIEAEAYRAKPISNFDTAALRLETVTDVEVLFYTTHSVPEQRGPVMYFEFENAVVKAGYGDNSIVAEHNDGSRHYYGTVNDQPMNKVWQMLKACRGEGEVWCGLEAASKQTMVVEALQNALPHIPVFPSDLIRESAVGEDGTHRLIWVDGLQDVMWTAFMDGVLMAEKGPEWANTVVIEA